MLVFPEKAVIDAKYGGPVYLNGKRLDPRDSQAIRNHSPDGFNWGYGGSGPAQLALAICLELYGEDQARRIYQHFKFRFVAAWPQGRDIVKELDLTDFNLDMINAGRLKIPEKAADHGFDVPDDNEN